jgi:hypothetical protein
MKMRRNALALACLGMILGAGMAGCNNNNTMSDADVQKMKEKPGAMPPGAMDDVAKLRAEYEKRHPKQNQPPPGVPTGAPPGVPGGH